MGTIPVFEKEIGDLLPILEQDQLTRDTRTDQSRVAFILFGYQDYDYLIPGFLLSYLLYHLK